MKRSAGATKLYGSYEGGISRRELSRMVDLDRGRKRASSVPLAIPEGGFPETTPGPGFIQKFAPLGSQIAPLIKKLTGVSVFDMNIHFSCKLLYLQEYSITFHDQKQGKSETKTNYFNPLT